MVSRIHLSLLAALVGFELCLAGVLVIPVAVQTCKAGDRRKISKLTAADTLLNTAGLHTYTAVTACTPPGTLVAPPSLWCLAPVPVCPFTAWSPVCNKPSCINRLLSRARKSCPVQRSRSTAFPTVGMPRNGARRDQYADSCSFSCFLAALRFAAGLPYAPWVPRGAAIHHLLGAPGVPISELIVDLAWGPPVVK